MTDKEKLDIVYNVLKVYDTLHTDDLGVRRSWEDCYLEPALELLASK